MPKEYRKTEPAPDILVTEAVKAVVGALTKEAVGPALVAGGRIWAWVKAQLSSVGFDNSLAVVEAAPEKPSSQTRLTGELLALLEDHPALVTELDKLLQETGARTATQQIATTTGHGNRTGQNAGQGNSITFGRP